MNRKTQEVICKGCNITFNKNISEIKRTELKNRNHYCSKKCYNDSQIKTVIKYCKKCNSEIIGKDKRNIFCSHSCSASVTNKNRKGEKRKFSEAGIKNIKSALYIRLDLGNNIDEYNTKPKLCKHCDKKLEFKFRKRIFCNINCRIQYNRKNMDEFLIYKQDTLFKFNLNDFPDEFDFGLIEKHGWYKPSNKGNNISGVSRDHMLSVRDGFDLGIDPKLISHPANCRLMIHSENISKNRKSVLNLNQLKERIKEWDKKYS
jgi:hypothetical protein